MARHRLVLFNRRNAIMQAFINNVLADGGTVEEEALSYAWANTPAFIQQNTTGVLLPGAYKSGKLYLMNPNGSLSTSMTYGRSTVATRVDVNGRLADVAINMPIINYNVDTGEGTIVFEHASTNDIANSHGFAGLSVDDSGASSATPCYSGATVKSFTRSVSGSEMSYGTRAYALFGFSGFVKAVDADKATLFVTLSDATKYLVHLNFSTGQVTSTGSTGSAATLSVFVHKLADGWYRIGIQGTKAAVTITKFGLGGADATQTIGTTLLTHSWQMQNTPVTSYIKTTGSSATKAYDNFSASLTSLFSIGESSMAYSVGWNMTFVPSNKSIWTFHTPGNTLSALFNPRITARFPDGINILGSGISINSPVPSYNILEKTAFRAKAGSKDAVALNGIITENSLATTDIGNQRVISNTNYNPSTRARFLYLAFFNTYLSDSDIIALT